MSCWVPFIPLALVFLVGLCFYLASRGELDKLQLENALLRAEIEAGLQRLAKQHHIKL